MITPNDEQVTKLEQTLIEAHRARHVPPLGTPWAQQVMRDIRLRAPQAEPGNGAEHLIWRAAAFAVAVALVALVSITAWRWTNSFENVSLMAEEFESTSLFVD